MMTTAIMTPATWGSVSVAQRMAAHGGVGPGFDTVRLGLSIMVILLHSFHTAYGYRPGESLAYTPAGPLFAAILPIFFGVSGFLVAGSALRTRSLKVFLTFRVLRIVPALAVEVTLSALVLGTLMTTLPLGDYFADPRFLSYFGNIIGWVHFELPGVFDGNPRSGIVNQNLWTLHPELLSYVLVAGLMLSALFHDRRRLTWAWAAITVAGIALNASTGIFEPHGNYPGKVLMYFFLSGVVAYQWRDRIPVDGQLAVVAVAAAYGLYWIPQTTFLIQFPLLYLMIWLGMQRFPRIDWLPRGDYSYGLYLYAYPVQQTLMALLPGAREWYFNLALTLPITLAIAMLSWHFVEKPALRLKRLVQDRPRAADMAGGALTTH